MNVPGVNANGGGAVTVFVILTLAIIVAIIAFIIYRIRRTDLQSVVVVRDPMKLFDMTGGPFRFPASRLPVTLNGQEFSFSFWIYLTDYAPTEDHKLLFMRGSDNNTSVLRASPIVYMDKGTNKMHVSVKTNLPPPRAPNSSELVVVDTLDEVLDRNNRYLTATVDYVPLQRWVNYVLVVQDNLLTVYQDGDMYTVENVHDMGRGSNERPVFHGINGDVLVGPVVGGGNVRGYMAGLQFFNYGLIHRDAKNLYDSGPSAKSILGRLGVSEYGLRSPIYRKD